MFASSISFTSPMLVGPFNPPSFMVPRLSSFAPAVLVCVLSTAVLSAPEVLSFTFVFTQPDNANSAHAITANILFFTTTSKIYLFRAETYFSSYKKEQNHKVLLSYFN